MLFLAHHEKDGQGSRAKIMETLRRHPGMNLSELRTAVGLNWTTTKYHLKRLEGQGVVELHKAGRRDIQCFPVGIPMKYRAWFATLRDEEGVQVLRILKEGEAGVAEIARRLGASESAARRRVERMLGDGLLTKRGTLRPRYARHPDCPAWAVDSGVPPPVDSIAHPPGMTSPDLVAE